MAVKSSNFHDTSIVEDGASIGSDTKIWHWTHVSPGAKIGQGCSLGQNVFIGNNVLIGDNVKIQNNVSVYDNVIIEDDVFCGPSMVFTNVYNPRSQISRKNEYRDTVIRKGASLGANCTIVCGTTIGIFAFIGAGAVVNKNVKDFALITGVPGKQIGWMSRYGERLELPLEGEGRTVWENTNEVYILKDGALTLLDGI